MKALRIYKSIVWKETFIYHSRIQNIMAVKYYMRIEIEASDEETTDKIIDFLRGVSSDTVSININRRVVRTDEETITL